MQLSGNILAQISILILGLCGFLVAKRIRDHKVKNTPLVCPMNFDCHAVVHSGYSRFFGVPIEIFGMIYYATISFAYLFFIIAPIPEIISVEISLSLIVVSSVAFLFSLYLIFIQIFVLKKGCSWCIVSAFICLLIFLLNMLNYDFSSITQIFVK